MQTYTSRRNKNGERPERTRCPREACEGDKFTGITKSDTTGCPTTYYKCKTCGQSFFREEIVTEQPRVATDGGTAVDPAPVLSQLDELREFEPDVELVAQQVERGQHDMDLSLDAVKTTLERLAGRVVARFECSEAYEYIWPTSGDHRDEFVSLYVRDTGEEPYPPVTFSADEFHWNRQPSEAVFLAHDQVTVTRPRQAKEGR